MGVSYKVYRPKKSIELEQQIKLIHRLYAESVKTEDTEYYAEFTLNNIDKFKKIEERLQIRKLTYSLSNPQFSLSHRDIKDIILNKNLYDWFKIQSEGFYGEATLGYRLIVNNKEDKLNISIGIPYQDLEETKVKVKDLIIYLHKRGIFFGLNEYNVDDCIRQFIDLNSSIKISNSIYWQFDVSGFCFSRGGLHVPNSKYDESNSKTHRLGEFSIKLPMWHSKRNDRLNFVVKLLDALDSFFSDKVSVHISSTNLDLIDKTKKITNAQFDLHSSIDLSKSEEPISVEEIKYAFEGKQNEICAHTIKLDKADYYEFNLRIIKNEDFELRVEIEYKAEESYKTRIENKLGFELKYESSE